MFKISSAFQWFGDKIKKTIDDKIDKGAINCGEKVVALAKSFAPVDTGALRDSINYTYNPSTHVLQINVGMPYGPFQEFGTYRMKPHPFIRPALAIAGPSFLSAFGVNVNMSTSLPVGYVPKPIKPHIRPSIHAAQKKYSRGKVKRSGLAFQHKPPNFFTSDAWRVHRDKSGLFRSKRAWN